MCVNERGKGGAKPDTHLGVRREMTLLTAALTLNWLQTLRCVLTFHICVDWSSETGSDANIEECHHYY